MNSKPGNHAAEKAAREFARGVFAGGRAGLARRTSRGPFFPRKNGGPWGGKARSGLSRGRLPARCLPARHFFSQEVRIREAAGWRAENGNSLYCFFGWNLCPRSIGLFIAPKRLIFRFGFFRKSPIYKLLNKSFYFKFSCFILSLKKPVFIFSFFFWVLKKSFFFSVLKKSFFFSVLKKSFFFWVFNFSFFFWVFNFSFFFWVFNFSFFFWVFNFSFFFWVFNFSFFFWVFKISLKSGFFLYI